MMEREYIKVNKPSHKLSDLVSHLKEFDDDFWKKWVFYYLVKFYKNHDSIELKKKIEEESIKTHPRIERTIAKYIRIKLNADEEFDYHFRAIGENTNDEDVEGNYDITIHSTNWKSKDFHFECKNLNKSQDWVNKYVSYNKGHSVFDGGVYRYFNGKYAQNLNFGGLIGFVLDGDVLMIKNKIMNKLSDKFDITPEGDLLSIVDSSIEENNFTFDSIHSRFKKEFNIHHILFDFS